MEHKIDIIAPEKVTFSYEPAGLGSRFLAQLIDILIGAVFLTLLLLVYIVLGSFLAADAPRVMLWITGFFLIIGFLAAWLYFILFEALMAGQTPGKRLAGIRVVDEAGRPPGFVAAVIRNLLRIADMLPMMYVAGMISILASKRNRRLGDMTAATLVIKDSPKNLRIDLPPAIDMQIPADVRLAARRLSPADYEQIRQFLVRRPNFTDESRHILSAKLANALTDKLNLKSTGHNAETLLAMLDASYRAIENSNLD